MIYENNEERGIETDSDTLIRHSEIGFSNICKDYVFLIIITTKTLCRFYCLKKRLFMRE